MYGNCPLTGRNAGVKNLFGRNWIIHNNPCVGKWQLALNTIEYLHSSAKYYLTGVQGLYEVANFMEMEDVDFKEGRQ